MNQKRLAALIKQPEIQQRILKNYDGGYAIGLTLNPANKREIAIRVRIEGEYAENLPRSIVLEDEIIPIVVSTDFQIPEPLPSQ